mmetsp:Transcript_16563/g.25729  ORF Transcript_16563/g.25729 Transcript_16563/m.25729 type:complete len:339 (+) Transcript_16563:2466-3482(+)
MKKGSVWHKIKLYIKRHELLKIRYSRGNETRRNNSNFSEINNYISISDQRNNFRIEINSKETNNCVIKIDNVPIPLLNSIRRLAIAETMSLAIEKVYFFDNSSIIPDEIIAHRLGLVPIRTIPDILDFFNDKLPSQKIILSLAKSVPIGHSKNFSIYSKNLKLKTYGLFLPMIKNNQINSIFRDILLLKLSPGQKIKCECHCKIGTGSQNCKFSPVAAVFYKICPKIKIVTEIRGNLATKIFKACPVRVFDNNYEKKSVKSRLVVTNPQFCTFCNNCLKFQDGGFDLIKIGRLKNRMTFVIESTGVNSAETLFFRALQLLVGKCNNSLIHLYETFSVL